MRVNIVHTCYHQQRSSDCNFSAIRSHSLQRQVYEFLCLLESTSTAVVASGEQYAFLIRYQQSCPQCVGEVSSLNGGRLWSPTRVSVTALINSRPQNNHGMSVSKLITWADDYGRVITSNRIQSIASMIRNVVADPGLLCSFSLTCFMYYLTIENR